MDSQSLCIIILFKYASRDFFVLHKIYIYQNPC